MHVLMDSRTAQPLRTSEAGGTSAARVKEHCLKEVFPYLCRRTRSIEDAEDLTAEVYGVALAQSRKPVEQMRAWLFGIARRKLADAVRRSPGVVLPLSAAESLIASDFSPEGSLQRQEQLIKIRALIDKLPEDQREALLLQYVEELSIIEIALAMNKSTAAVNSLLQRARASIFEHGKTYFLDNSEATL
jgi:RNA polymerase sigma-70 factor (ECF subfamily)